MPIALIVELACAIIGQTGTFVSLVEYLKGHPDHSAATPLPPEHQTAVEALVTALRTHVATASGAPALPWDRQ